MIETEFGQGVTYQDEIRPGKSRGDDSIQGEKLGEKGRVKNAQKTLKRSKNLEMQEVREMGRKKDGEEWVFQVYEWG